MTSKFMFPFTKKKRKEKNWKKPAIYASIPFYLVMISVIIFNFETLSLIALQSVSYYYCLSYHLWLSMINEFEIKKIVAVCGVWFYWVFYRYLRIHCASMASKMFQKLNKFRIKLFPKVDALQTVYDMSWILIHFSFHFSLSVSLSHPSSLNQFELRSFAAVTWHC